MDEGHAVPGGSTYSDQLSLQSVTMNTGLRITYFLLGLLLFTTAGCSIQSKAEHQPLDLEGPVAVQVNSFAGDVTVRSIDLRAGARPHVAVTRESSHGIRRYDKAREAMDSISWSARIDRGAQGPVLVVDVVSTAPSAMGVRADVVVEVPIVDGLSVHTTKGDIEVEDVSGPVELITTDGSVELLSDLALRGPLKILTSEGDVNVRLQAGTSGQLDFMAKDGRVGLYVRAGQMRVKPGTSNDSCRGQLGDSTEPFVVRTTHGVIRFTVKHNPKPHGIFHMD